MQTKLEELKKLIGEKSSFTTNEANNIGVSNRLLSLYSEKGDIERVGRGLYIFPEFDVGEGYEFHELALASKSIKDSVVCLISALNYWDVTDEIPREHWLAIPNNFSIPKGKKRCRFIRPRDLENEVVIEKIAGIDLKITSIERSVCDAFKYLDSESAISSMKQYMIKENTDIETLLNIAEMTKTKKVISIIKELAEAMGLSYPKMTKEDFKSYQNWLMKRK